MVSNPTMATRQVIQDSDDEAEAISPVNSPRTSNILTEHMMDLKATPSNPAGTSSTDPVLFQKIYDNQYRAAMHNSPPDPTSSAQPPVLEDQIINQRMSSSPISVKRLKRSRTMNSASLTSPPEAQHRTKRTKSLRDMDNLTQLTTPGEKNQELEAAMWEFTGSSASKPTLSKVRRLGKETVAKENVVNEKKTYGRLRRSKTMAAHNRSSQYDTWNHEQAISNGDNFMSTEDILSRRANVELGKPIASKEKMTYAKLKRSKTLTSIHPNQSEIQGHEEPSSKDDSHGLGQKRRASSSQNFDLTIPAPRTKKQKHDLHGTRVGSENASNLVELMGEVSYANVDGIEIQVPQTASEQDVKPVKSFDLSFGREGSSIVTSPCLKTSLSNEAFVEKSTGSISIVPATMTDSQKMTYETFSVVSTNQTRRSSIVTPDLERIERSSAVPNETLQPSHYSESVKVHRERLSSSPPILTASSKTKRAKSLPGVEARLATSQAPVSSIASVTSTIVPKMKRSQTIASGPSPQSSFDELSYTKSQELGKSMESNITSKENRKKAKEKTEERVNANDLLDSDKFGLPRELYQPRPSRRRSKSIGITSIADATLNLVTPLPPLTRKKSIKAAKVMSDFPNAEASAEHSNNILGSVENDEFATAERPTDNSENKNDHPAIDADSHVDEIILPNTNSMNGSIEIGISEASYVTETPSISVPPVAPKRRGRPPNVLAAGPAAEKAVKKINENHELLGGPLESMETTAETTPKAAPPAKRRGRPLKATEKVVETKEVESHPNEDTLVESVPTDAGNAHHEIRYDAHSEDHVEEPSWSKPADYLFPKSTPPQTTEEFTALALVTPTKHIKKGPDHSPLPSSKVPHRVGLSKRSRIAPLLKMIRK